MSNDEYQHQQYHNNLAMESREQAINLLIKEADSNKISDGYHTFGELYDHRHALYINMCKLLKREGTLDVWRSVKHSDGTVWKDWFILGVNKDKGCQITYHLPISLWESTMWAETLDKAPDFDGHSSTDVLTRLKILV